MISGMHPHRGCAGRRWAGAAWLACAAMARSEPADLPRELARAGDHGGAAIEYRRLSLASETPAERAGWAWAAAREHWRDGRAQLADRMLDRAEVDGVDPIPLRLLRAEAAAAAGDLSAASFFWQSVADDDGAPEAARVFSSRRAAAALIRQDRPDDAARRLRAAPVEESSRLAAVEEVRAAPRKRPIVGGVLGLVPGLGYAYSGEYANAGRSFLLNALFMGFMALAARDDNWGAFGVASFFELTWYSGSIYGGIDAAHRWNRRLLDDAGARIEEGLRWDADEAAFPLLRLRFDY